ncbi:SDR family oxidoreductase [Methylicorpusculum sp.]|uniref:SDR family oxidoreductase n=2 Tax=Methylicorpusculum sp. TaxID=2713644 RepID=UPI0027310200|nr:SDR family oxidoreductase [Methylicorpusculum sp.]MDP2177246.1 SDR family oxidoreductase [Methylicorpusculum sp.]MDP3531171.1 SDR family oxidoreductase [Methylicorpusculum sp.]
MANILIAGCGDIGIRLAGLLHRENHQVTGIRRHPPENLNETVNFYQADLTEASSFAALPLNFDEVVFMPTPGQRSLASYQAVYDTALENLLKHFEKAEHPPHWFFISSTSVYGQSNGEWIDEDSVTEANTPSGQIIRRAELRLLSVLPDTTIVRFSGIYGPGREYLLNSARTAPEIMRDPPYYTNRIHQDDCAGVLGFLIGLRLKGEKLATYYLASDDDPAPQWEVVSWMTEQMGCLPPAVKPPSTPPDLNKRCDNKRLKALDYQFIYPDYRNGYLPMIQKIVTDQISSAAAK